MVRAVYIHIPFCNNICSYCDFCKLLYNKKYIDIYLQSLEKEIKSIYKNDLVDSIYIGGGTPSSLSIDELEKLFQILCIFKKSKNCEITIEGNFESTTTDKLLLYKKYGVNRLSFGIETINKKILEYLNRSLDINNVKYIINYARKIGINNINLDLMYAFKEETLVDLRNDLDFILSLNPTHISTYSLIIEEHTKLGILHTKNIDDELDLKMYNFICNYLNEKDFIHYEISNFSKNGYQSKHNLVYWNNDYYYGFGLGACSYLNSKRISNTRSINKYLDGNYILNIENLNIYDKMEYQIILNLRTSKGINKEKFRELYGKNIEKCYNYSELVRLNLLFEDSVSIWINPSKWYISNKIILMFLEGVL